MKKSIILFLNNDEIFTFPIVYYLVKRLSKKYNFYVKLNSTTLKKKIKILLIILLEGDIIRLYNFYKKKLKIDNIISLKNVSLINSLNDYDYFFGISINYPKKIKYNKLKIYNFHYGNFESQRGTFIFFYKKIFKWKTIDITFHKINNKFDSGKIIDKKTFDVKKLKTLDMISLPLKNMNFYLNCILNLNKGKRKYTKIIGPSNKEPSFFQIFLQKIKLL